MIKQNFGTKLSGYDWLTETCYAEKYWRLKTENQPEYACLRSRYSHGGNKNGNDKFRPVGDETS